MWQLQRLVELVSLMAMAVSLSLDPAVAQPAPTSPKDTLIPFCNRDGLWGYADEEGLEVIKPKFALAGAFSEKLAPVQTADGGFRFIGANGENVGQSFALADVFSEGLAAVKAGKLFGFVDPKLKFVIEPQFEWAGTFHDDRAAVRVKGKYGFIDTTGKLVIPAAFSRVMPFSDGVAGFEQDGRWGYVRQNGTIALNAQYREALPFSFNRAWVSTGEQFYCIDLAGERAIDAMFDVALPFSETLAPVRVGGNTGLIDMQGKFAIGLGAGPVWKSYTTGGQVATFHSGQKVLVAKKVGENVVFETKIDPRFKLIKFQSTPAPARVYCPTLWAYVHAASRRDVMTPQHRIPEGDTNCESPLDIGQRYRVIFEKDNRIEESEFAPAQHDTVKARFP